MIPITGAPMSNTDGYKSFDHDAYARTKAANDFWGQVRRTVNGVPVSDEQIAMITSAIRTHLAFKPRDFVLDLACGNGALSTLLFPYISGFLGIDLSTYLIDVAQKNFERPPNYTFLAKDVAQYTKTEQDPARFTKALCYGSFQYFPAEVAQTVLKLLYSKFSHLERVFIGNLPDKERASEFYKDNLNKKELNDSNSQIGIWRSKNEFEILAKEAGWKIQFFSMPPEFYASHYRYDVLLTR
jgi:cyclopropane fatty-acyl-phospholipid synthase-like methyltransferase